MRQKCIILSLPFFLLFCSQMQKGERPPDLKEESPLLTQGVSPASNASYHYMRAELKRHEGDLDGTIDELKKAITHDSKSPLLRVELARLYTKKEMVNEAIAECREALSIDGNFVPAHVVPLLLNIIVRP